MSNAAWWHGAAAAAVCEARRVSVFAAAGTVAVLGAKDTLRGGDVLPLFAIPAADLFPPLG